MFAADEKKFKTESSESRIRALMNAFDDSGDGALQLEEFVTIVICDCNNDRDGGSRAE